MRKWKILFLFALTLSCSYGWGQKFGPPNLPAGSVWLGYGWGTSKINEPASDMDSSDFYWLELASEFKAMSRIHVVFGAFASTNEGTLNYNYLNAQDNLRYSSNNVKYTMETQGGRVGLHWKILYTNFFRIFVEMGGYGGLASVTYDVDKNTEVTSVGNSYKKKSKNIWEYGGYGLAGAEIIIGGFGVRASVRQLYGETGRVDGLNDKVIRYSNPMAFIGLMKSF